MLLISYKWPIIYLTLFGGHTKNWNLVSFQEKHINILFRFRQFYSINL